MYSPWFWPKRTRQESLFSEPTVEKNCPALLRCEVKNKQKCKIQHVSSSTELCQVFATSRLAKEGPKVYSWYTMIQIAVVPVVQLFYFFSDVSDLVFNGLDWTAQSSIHLVEFRSVMLATLRSLCPKDWDTDHEAN